MKQLSDIMKGLLLKRVKYKQAIRCLAPITTKERLISG